MSRLHKKCLIGSAGFHLLLVVVLFVGPQLLASRQQPDDSQTITMVDLSKLTDGPTQTGGGPAQAPPPAPPPATPPEPAVEPPPVKAPEPEPPKVEKSFLEKIFEPDPPKVEKKVPEVSDQKIKVKAQDEVATKPKEKPKVEVAKQAVKVAANSNSKPSPSAADEAKARAAAAAKAHRAAVNRTVSSLSSGLSTGTDVVIPGPGAGTFVNYGEAVRIKYTAAWIAPADVTDDNATVKVSVTIARDGTVITAKVKTPSGSAAVDRSVEETLRRVKYIAPFPEGATDSERTFIINFNLKAKRLLG